MYNLKITAKNCNYKYFIMSILIFLIFLPLTNNGYSKFILVFFNCLYLISFLIKIILFAYGYILYKNVNYYKKIDIQDSQCPIYTILVPLYKEKLKTINLLLKSLYKLDYPKEKLDIKLIIEEDDLKTIEIINKLEKRFCFDTIIVPDKKPKTKPKACNYALRYARGKFVTIYDAEDRPEKYQLKKAVKKFNEYSDDYICMQASLNYYNKKENYLTKFFCVEYSLWFDFTLRVLEKFSLFFPLGGTSNHFKKDKLLEIGGWDSYNVTEDADLGVRIARLGYKIGFLNSITDEEAPINLRLWVKQRTRWIKGFIQTYCVHMSNPIELFYELGWKNFIIFQIFVGMSSIFFISLPFISIINFLNLDYLKYFSKLNFYLMVFFMVLSFYIVIKKNRFSIQKSMAVLFPLYWILHLIAGLRALYQIAKKPFYWEKTEHGVSKMIGQLVVSDYSNFT